VIRLDKGTIFAAAFAAALLLPHCARAKLRIFVVNASDNTVSVVDGDLDREIKTIKVGYFPQGLAIRYDPPLLAVANSRDNSVSLIDPVTLEVKGEPIPVGRFPLDMKFSPDGKRLYCTSYDEHNISVVDVASRRIVGDPISVGAPPRRIALSKDGKRIYALRYQKAAALVVADTQTRKVIKEIPISAFPTDMVVTPDGKRLFAASFNGNKIDVIDLEKLEPAGSFDMDVGDGLLIHPSKPLLYSIATFDDQIVVKNYDTKKDVATIPVGEYPIYSAITPDGHYLYIVNSSDSNLMKIDTETDKVVTKIAVGKEPTDARIFVMPSERPSALLLIPVAAAIALLLGWWLFRRRRPSA